MSAPHDSAAIARATPTEPPQGASGGLAGTRQPPTTYGAPSASGAVLGVCPESDNLQPSARAESEPAPRRHTDRTPSDVLAGFAVGIGVGWASAALLLGVLRVFA